MFRRFLAIGLLGFGWAIVQADDTDARATDEAAIRKAVESYVEVYNKADEKALAAMWTPEAVYIDPVSGDQAVGHVEIEQQFLEIFADAKGIKLEATTDSIQFILPGVAVENGIAKLIQAEQSIEEGGYSAIYAKRDGQWLLDRVTEHAIIAPLSNYENLKDLEWMVGRWMDQDEQSAVTTECNWCKNSNFLSRSFSVQIGDQIDMSGMQWIGWDPSTKQIRSWVFDSDGGFGQGI